MIKHLFFPVFLLLVFHALVMGQGTVTAVPTFNCVGIYWSGHGQTGAATVKYREQGSSTWNAGLDLWQDSRAINGRPAGEYRGSIVGLKAGTMYEYILNAGSATASGTFQTWAETFPVASVTTLSAPATLSTSGTATGYRVYTGSISGGQNNLVISGSFIIVRNMTLTGAGEDAIILAKGAHDVIIEGCDISGWGYVGMGSNNQAAIRCKQGASPYRIIVQRNNIHDSREKASAWDASGSSHPLGPNGINWEYPGENNVIRYNNVVGSYTDPSRRFMDGIGGADNFTYTGFPGANSDIYGNFIEGVYDDGIEAEGGAQNVRVWGNWINNSFTGVATATVSIGPLYSFNNVTNVGQRLIYGTAAGTLDTEDRGPFNKCGSQDATYRGGREYLFHNTVLQPKQAGFANPRGLDGGIVDNGGPVANIVSRNNIWQTAYSGKGGLPIAEWQTGSGTNCSYDYDLYNVAPKFTNGKFGGHQVQGSPTYTSSQPLTLDTAGYYLTSASKGYRQGVAINNFNDGVNVDIGAYQNGHPRLEFGVKAYLSPSAPPPTDTTTTPPIVTPPPPAKTIAYYILTLKTVYTDSTSQTTQTKVQ